MDAAPRYYVTTPIYYVNDRPHIGHTYTTLACDALARFMRLDGHHVWFLTGTDEHGQKVEKSAQAAGMDPQAFTDQVSANFRALDGLMNFSNDDFIRTTEDRHVRACQALWQAIAANGDIYLGNYAGWYSVRDEAFFGEDELRDVDGRKIAPSGAEVEWVEEPSYFFRLSAWGDRLLAHYREHPEAVLPATRRNEVIRFIEQGLQDLSISRTTFKWGVKVPGDDRHIMYVWLDALTNYITAIGYPDIDSDRFRTFWPADLHMVGKDIVRFHAIYWPAFLMSAGLPPPRRVFAHGWWTNEGEKISKSLGNVIDPHDLVVDYGLDQVRYFLLREVPFGNDGDFSRRAIIGRVNGDLANDLGNLAQRVLSMVGKHCGAEVPAPGAFADADTALLDRARGLLAQQRADYAVQSFNRALEAVWAVIGDANRYVDEQAPWALRKTDPARMGTVLYVVMETLRHVGLVLQPVMPDTMGRLLDQLGVAAEDRSFAHWGEISALRGGTTLPPSQGLFPRYVDKEEAS